MSDNDKNQTPMGTDCLTGASADSLDDLFKDVYSNTFTLPPLTGGSMAGSLGSITVNTGTTGSSYNYPYISPTTPPTASPSQYSYGNSSGTYSWGQTALGGIGNSPNVKITCNGIDMPDVADIKFGDQSLKTFMKAVSERLAILQPDPAKLEKFEALKMAYEHYKTLEALCCEDDRKEDK